MYKVSIMIFLVNNPDISHTQTITVGVDPCLVESVIPVQTIDDIVYEIGSGPLTSGPFSFEQEPAACDYPITITTSGNPFFMVFDQSQSSFVIENSD